MEEVVTDPLNQRVLDPGCGSGTFLFHAIRHYVAAAKAAGRSSQETIAGVVGSVTGVDLHPVAVTLARVTYLLAIGKALYTERGPEGFSIPVYLGDSLQWRQTDPATLFGTEGVHIPTADGLEMFAQELVFPESALADVAHFDALVADLAVRSTNRKRGTAAPKLPKAMFAAYGVPEDDRAVIQKTFAIMCGLHDNHRDHIWGYYVRNLARPLWLARVENRVDALVGNPPWLAYRFMPDAMQETFAIRGDSLGVRPGGKLATQADLAAFFVITAVETYLRSGGRFGFVMPRSALQGAHYAGFRTGGYPLEAPRVAVSFAKAWDLAHIKPNSFFPVPSSVVFGQRTGTAGPLGSTVDAWAGPLANPAHATLAQARAALSRADAVIKSTTDKPASPYHPEFRNGATLQPRMLTFVRERPAGPLGVGAGRTVVISRRSGDKHPWVTLPDCIGEVESQFVRRAYLGENIAPFRVLGHDQAVIPWHDGCLLEGSDEDIDAFPGLAAWWRQAEKLWGAHSSGKMSLRERIDYQHLLTDQNPIAPHKVVYAASGTYMAAARLDDPEGIIENRLWWRAANDPAEALYLVGVLNSDTLLAEVIPLQPMGQFGTRHFHRYPLHPPIPRYDPSNHLHVEISTLAGEAEEAALLVEPSAGFQKTRQLIRTALRKSGLWDLLEVRVTKLIFEGAAVS